MTRYPHWFRPNVRGRGVRGPMIASPAAPLVLGILLALFHDSVRAELPQAGVAPLAGLRLPDLDGATVELASYLGRGPVVLDFWATWCKPCLEALPDLQSLHADLAPRGVQVVGINEDVPRNAPKVKPFVQTRKITFPVLLDLNREAQRRLRVPGLPTTILLDRDGKIVHTSIGGRPGEVQRLREKIEVLLQDAPAE